MAWAGLMQPGRGATAHAWALHHLDVPVVAIPHGICPRPAQNAMVV